MADFNSASKVEILFFAEAEVGGLHVVPDMEYAIFSELSLHPTFPLSYLLVEVLVVLVIIRILISIIC